MCKFTEIRLRRIEAAIIKDIQTLNDNLDTVIRFFECNAISAKKAYKRASAISARFDILLTRLQNAVHAANLNDRYTDINYTPYFVEHPDYIKIYHEVYDKLNYFAL